MDKESTSRTRKLIGEEEIAQLGRSRVAVFGLGGVGGHVVEALARSGIGALDLVDNDRITLSNINRQIAALHSTVGQWKTEVVEERVKDINPDIQIRVHKLFFLPETADEFDFSGIDYIVDAIDTVSGKVALIKKAKELNIPIVSSMGTANKLNPTKFRVADISETSVCPLARVMRRELKKQGIEHVKTVYSTEEPVKTSVESEDGKKRVPASVAFVPAVAGMIIAGEVILDLIE